MNKKQEAALINWLLQVEQEFGMLGEIFEKMAAQEEAPTPEQAGRLSKPLRSFESQARQMRAIVTARESGVQ